MLKTEERLGSLNGFECALGEFVGWVARDGLLRADTRTEVAPTRPDAF